MPRPKTDRRFWQPHVKALTEGGFSCSEYCRWHSLSYYTLTYWVHKQRGNTPAKPSLALVEVSVRPSLPLAVRCGCPSGLHFDGGRMLEIDPDFEHTILGRILTVTAQQR